MSLDGPSDAIERSLGERKLIAVVYAVMAGYSRLIGVDDAGTLARLKRLRTDLIDPAISEHRGRVVQTGGDSLLVVFDSIDGAVRCAVKVQQQVPIHDESSSPDHAIRFRMGINIGDAIADGTDLHGDAVNVAARLQAECPPGAICVSRSVRDHVHGRLGLQFEGLGALDLRNITRPVEAFVLKPTSTAAPNSIGRTFVHGIGEARLLPDKPSIAVLPFANMSGDLEQEYFSDGIADDIITELSRCHSLLVTARNSSFSCRGRSVDAGLAAHDLGVRYVVTGSVRREARRVRINAQLIDAETGNHIWTERYDREIEHVFVVQDEISAAVVTAIQPAVAGAELRRALRKSTETLGAWEAFQRGLWHLAKSNAEDNVSARRFFEQSAALDPLFAPAYVGLAHIHTCEALFQTKPIAECVEHAEPLVRHALELDPSDAAAMAVLAWVFELRGDHDAAMLEAEHAISINPNCAFAYHVKGRSLEFSGYPAEALKAFKFGLRLNPYDPLNRMALSGVTIAHYFLRDYRSAAAVAEEMTRAYPDFPVPYRWLAASHGQLGRLEEAQIALSKARQISPASFDFYSRNRAAWYRPQDYEHLLDGLRKAGWQG